MAVLITVTCSGTLDPRDRITMEHIIGQENEKRLQADENATVLPTDTDQDLLDSYAFVLDLRAEELHRSYAKSAITKIATDADLINKFLDADIDTQNQIAGILNP